MRTRHCEHRHRASGNGFIGRSFQEFDVIRRFLIG
jgi:hypothetical protein